MEDETLHTADDPVEPVEGAESAPASEGQHESKVIFDEAQQSKVEEIIGKKTYEYRQQEREWEAERAKLQEELEALRSKAPQNQRPGIPDFPDPYDDDYEEKIRARDEAIRKAAEFDAVEARRKEQAEWQRQQEHLQAAKALEDKAKAHVDRGMKLGMTEDELRQSGQLLANFGISEDIAEFLLEDDQGPLIQRYLAQHPQELDQVVRMSKARGLVHVATEIKSKAAAVKKTTEAPEPPELLEGGGSPRKKRGPEGLLIE